MQKEQLDIIQAWLDGITIQHRSPGRSAPWLNYPNAEQADSPPSVLIPFNWRIKPATKWWAVVMYVSGGIAPVSRKTKEDFKYFEQSPEFKCWIFEPAEKEIPE